jgi:hypothetical protein
MENENVSTEQTEEIQDTRSQLNKVTPLSKYLAMGLFVALPFLGGWVGWNTAVTSLKLQEGYIVPISVSENTSNSKLDTQKSDLATRNTEGKNYKQINKIDFEFVGKSGSIFHHCEPSRAGYFGSQESPELICLGENKLELELDGRNIVIATSSTTQLDESYSISLQVSTSTNFSYLEIYVGGNELIYACEKRMCIASTDLKYIVNLDDLSVTSVPLLISSASYLSWNSSGTRFVFSDNKHWPNLNGYSLDTQELVIIFDSGNGGIRRPDFKWIDSDTLILGNDEFSF